MISDRLEKLVEEMVDRGVHFEDAAVPALPFFVRLIAAPGVSSVPSSSGTG